MIGTLARGAAAGVAATTIMTGVMKTAQRMGLLDELPPRTVANAALDAAGLEDADPTTRTVATGLAHYGYGAGMGAVFAGITSKLPFRAPRWLEGAVFGLFVWVFSYMGWLPAAKILPSPTRDRPGRPITMVIAHLVYGGILGVSLERREA
ncbi:MAG: hypothetical protein Q8P41_04055 [Pseudomonadota bacterium]|nr:hypothetical protein [Pseudomonadota bacterium]